MFSSHSLVAISKTIRLRILAVVVFLAMLRRRIRVRSEIVRRCLPPRSNSSWEVLLSTEGEPGFDTSFRQYTGLSREGFNYILLRFKQHPFWGNPKRLMGKSIGPEKHLALTLWYLKTTGHQFEIQIVFGLTRSPLSSYISTGLEVLVDVLYKDPYCIIKWPTDAQKDLFARTIAQKRPILAGTGIWGFLDGFRLPMEKFGDAGEENGYYSFKYSHNMGNVIVGTPDGCVCWAALNLPGSWHDSKIAGTMYDKIKKDQPRGNRFKLLADTAFKNLGGRIVRTQKWNRNPESKAHAGIRVAAEWNVRTINGTWRRVKKKLGVNYKRNGLIIRLAVYLTNFRARFESIGQTRTWFEENNPFSGLF
jgi:DDE superfamily endonuclease